MTGMKPQAIQEFLRKGIGSLDSRADSENAPQKNFFVDVRYINHIGQRMKAGNRLHTNDHTSVDIHVRNLTHMGRFEIEGLTNKNYDGFCDGKFSPVLCFKPQGQPTLIGSSQFDNLKHGNDLFIVGIQTKEQYKVLLEGSKTVLCIDSTHCTTEYGYYLVNLVVPDAYGRGYPVAHFITSHQDQETLVLAFDSIKSRCPELQVNFLMTDDDQSEYRAFLRVFPGTRHALCIWHVRRNWAKHTNTISNKDLKVAIYHTTAVLMYEKDKATFHNLMESFVDDFRHKCPAFIDYFINYYANRPEVWAMCYRNFPHGSTGTNMYCETLHNKIKTLYMERKQNRRVDDLLELIMRMETDFYIKLWQRTAEGRPKVKVSDAEKRKHIRGMEINDDDVVKTDKSNLWVVKSQTNKKSDCNEYFVLQHQVLCTVDHPCFMKCSNKLCKGLCEHLYSCTCPTPGAMCKHIHKIHSLTQREVSTNYKDRVGEFWDWAADDGMDLHLVNPTDNNVQSSDQIDQKLIAECQAICQLVNERLSQPGTCSALLPQIKKQLQQVEILTRNMHSTPYDLHLNSAGKFEATMSVKGPQKLEPQRDIFKFKRTAKKPQHTKALKNPTFEERSKIKHSLLSLKGREMIKRQRKECLLDNPDETLNIWNASEVCNQTEVPSKVMRMSHLGNLGAVPSLESDRSNLCSKSFTPKLRYVGNIYEPIIFFGTNNKISFQSLKSLDPYLTNAECLALSSKGFKFTRGWINEDVIDAYLHYLCEGRQDMSSLPSCFTNLLNNSSEFQPACTVLLLKNDNLLTKNTILVPTNITNNHWVLLVIKPKLLEIHFYDPMDSQCSATYLSFLPKLTSLLNKYLGNSLPWGIKCPLHILQEDSCNCWAFICYYATNIARGSASSTTSNMNKFREVMYSALSGKCFANETYSVNHCVLCLQKITSPQVRCFN